MAQKPKKAAPVTVQRGVFIYLGPSIRGVIQNASIYAGSEDEVRSRLSRALGKYPEIGTLLVPAAAAGEVRQLLNRGGNVYATAYKKLTKR